MGKKYISKSSENLSSQRKGRQLSTVAESPRPRANAASIARAEAVRNAAAAEKNKENVALKEREKNAGFAKPKPVKPNSGNNVSGGGIRKASSTQSIDKTSQGSGSLKSSSSSSSTKSSNSLAIKRAQSTQNICKDKFTKKRTSAPADVMAYNAELLANFEKEKKNLEVRISELTKVAESRKGEIEKYRYEVKRLKDQVSGCTHLKEELELLRHQNKQLNDRLHELGYPAEQITDSEKLLLKFSTGPASSSAPNTGSTSKGQESQSDTECLPKSTSCDSLSTDGGGAKGGLPHSLSSSHHNNHHHIAPPTFSSASLPPPSTSSSSHLLTGSSGPILIPGSSSSHHHDDHAHHHKDSSSGHLVIGEGGASELRRSTSLSASEPGLSLPDLCGTPDHPSVLSLEGANWDKQSNKSANSDGGLSEASVACLTERILQMEETNYSTTEELQATLQELGDLQDTVNELTEEHSRLADEKAVLLESLCTQTEKLENTRIQLEQLKCLLISGELPDKSERDGHLLGLLKSAQEEREELMRKQTEWSNAMQALENECRDAHEAGEALRDRFSLLEDGNKSLLADRKELENQLQEMKESQEAEHIEVKRLKTLLENEKSKVCELETARQAQDKTDVEALLDCARQDKARLEQRVADLTESLALSQCEVTRLKDCLATKEQDLIVARNNAKSQVDDLQFRLETGEKAKVDTELEMSALRKHVDSLEQDIDQHVENNKTLSSKLNDVQSELRNLMQQKQSAEDKMNEMCSKFDMESEEWKQFQKDLQTAVVIANNQTQELQEENEQLMADKTQLQEQVAGLRAEVDKLKHDMKLLRHSSEDSPTRKTSIMTNAELKGKVFNTMDRELAALREGRSPLDQRSQSISVKSLIRSIEEQVKSGCSSIHSSRSESRRSSASSDISLKDLVKSPTSPLPTPDSPRSPTKDFSLRSSSFRGKSTSGDISPQQRLGGGVSGGGTVIGGGPSPGEGGSKNILGSRGEAGEAGSAGKSTPQISSILKDRSTPRRNSGAVEVDTSKKETPGKDPLASLAKLMKGSKRNALLKWCQLKTINYSYVDITNFSSSWNDGLGFCALLHCYLPDKIPYADLSSEDKRKNFTIAFNAGESVGIKSNLNINDMVAMERPDWQAVMNYVTAIYKHFEVDKQ
ncbi:cytospin-A [Aplysia californica]|uniref:Cytospin-A n=1 Tax=Aplysia californica TaxID=6500 RepID=A0ABM1W0M3_APLCA|nr:cytospin-A [Aplysia californica]